MSGLQMMFEVFSNALFLSPPGHSSPSLGLLASRLSLLAPPLGLRAFRLDLLAPLPAFQIASNNPRVIPVRPNGNAVLDQVL